MNPGWSARFEDPIPLPAVGALTTLREAAAFIIALPKAEQQHPAWQLAVATLLAAAEGRDFLMHARIAVLRGLNRGTRPPISPNRATSR